jgi:porin
MRAHVLLVLTFLWPGLLLSEDDRDTPSTHQKMYDYLEQHGQSSSLSDPWSYTMTGDWGGARSYLLEHGFLLSGSYVSDNAGNPSGGKARGFADSGSLGVGVDIDFEQACNLTGLEFYGSMTWRTGTSLSRDKIGNQFPVQQNFGSQTVKLGELYLKERLFKDRVVLKAGRLQPGNDFLASPYYCQFMSNAFCGNPISIFFNIPSFTALPNAIWGAYLSYKPIPQLYAQFAVFNANTKVNLNKYHGVNFTFKSTNGVIWITEWAARINQEPKSPGMPGNYKIGFMYQTGNAKVFTNGMVHGNYCAYVLIDQTIYQEACSTRSITPFIALLFSPKSRNLLPFFIDGGVILKGPFAKRPNDSINFGFAYGKYSSDDPTLQSSETDLELNYWYQVNGWCAITPVVQYIINPQGLGTIPNAFVIGAQIGFSL